ACRRRSGDRFRIWIDDGMNRVRPAGTWSRVLALVRVLIVVLVIMFTGVHVSAITIVITPEFMVRHPTVGTKARSGSRTSHSTARIAALGKGTLRRCDQKNRSGQHHGPARQFAGSVEVNHRSPFDCFAGIESPRGLRYCTGEVYKTATVIEPLS